MSERKNLACTLWITSLMASMLVAPVRSSSIANVPSRSDGLRRDFAPVAGRPTVRPVAAMPTDGVLEVNALPSDSEEQDRVIDLDEPGGPFSIPSSFRKASNLRSLAPRSIPSHYPLRC